MAFLDERQPEFIRLNTSIWRRSSNSYRNCHPLHGSVGGRLRMHNKLRLKVTLFAQVVCFFY